MGWLYVNDMGRAHLKNLISTLLATFRNRILKEPLAKTITPHPPLSRRNQLYIAGDPSTENEIKLLSKLENLPPDFFCFKEVMSPKQLTFGPNGQLLYESHNALYGTINLTKRKCKGGKNFPTLFRLIPNHLGELEA